ncbi:DUF4259 domain-containing protein [Streptomyces sp. NPDC002308]
MGTWGIGHFDNDTAADFGGKLDDSDPEKRAALIEQALEAAVHAGAEGFLDSDEAMEAVAAAALLAAQCPGGEPVATPYGPDEPVPLPGGAPSPVLLGLAVRALDQVTAETSELRELWGESAEPAEWLAGIGRLRTVLAAGVPV